jgi:hypothetical protein
MSDLSLHEVREVVDRLGKYDPSRQTVTVRMADALLASQEALRAFAAIGKMFADGQSGWRDSEEVMRSIKVSDLRKAVEVLLPEKVSDETLRQLSQ